MTLGLGARVLNIFTGQRRSELTRADSEVASEKTKHVDEWHPDHEHATRLIQWCFEGEEPLAHHGEVAARSVMRAYNDMCCEIGWLPRPWNQVGRELRLILNGGRKIYSGAKRERVYRFSKRCPV